MEQLKWTTPIKNRNECENLANKSPVIYQTPVKQYERHLKHTMYPNSMGDFSVLPSHITPPSGLTKFIARNPFETDLTNRLHLSMISPTVFKTVSSPSQQPSNFAWSVDELALIQPAKIEEFPIQQIHCTDPEIEIKAQAAIDRFFNENQIIPSPWEIKAKENRAKLKVNTPLRFTGSSNSDSYKTKKDGWSQTVLSLPSELPAHVMEILKPYLTFTQEQNVENDDANSSNNSLRRKLFFNHEDIADNEENSSDCLSPMKMNGSLVLSSSPPQSGMLVHGAPFKHSPNEGSHRNTSQINAENVSPPNISPIHSTVNNMSCESMKSRSRSVARLDFTTDMSIDQSSIQYKELPNNTSVESINKIDAKVSEKADNFLNWENDSICAQIDNHTETKALVKTSTHGERNFKTAATEFNVKYRNATNAFAYSTDSYKMNTNESYVLQQTNVMFGISDQQSVSNSAQDTGYQTYSMSSTTNVTDSHNNTPAKQKACWGEQILRTEDEFHVPDWKENMKNIFCSTPSRSNRERDSHIF